MLGVTVLFLCFLAPHFLTVSGKEYIVELNVVVDDLAFHYWKQSTGKTTDEEFKEEIYSSIFEAAELYKTLPESFKVRFIVKNLILHAVNVVKGDYGIVLAEGLGQFEDWMYREKPFNRTDHDVAVLLTGNDVASERTKSLFGFGRIGYVCTKYATALVEFRSATYKNAFVLSHEIGHVLGADHDGTADEHGSQCKVDGYVMTAGVTPWSEKHFHYSYCSYSYFYYHFADLPWDCMDNGDPQDYVKGKRLGTLMTADQACQRDLDQWAFVSRQAYWTYGDEVCTQLRCDKGNGDIVGIFSPQGLYCGKNKQCIQDKCVETPEGKSDVSDECPFGDQPTINYKGYKSCDDLPLHECGVMKNLCCKRCNLDEMASADRVCREIEKNPKAQLYRKGYTEYGYGDTFCQWIACTTGKENGNEKAEWGWNKTPDGMICGKNKRCSEGKCKPADDGLDYIDDNCPFGDLSSFDCINRIGTSSDPHNSCGKHNYRGTCCASCKYI